MNPTDFFMSDPKISGGEIVLKGTRVPLRTVLASLAEGDSFEVLLASFPSLTTDHLRAAVAYAAFSALEDQALPAVPQVQ